MRFNHDYSTPYAQTQKSRGKPGISVFGGSCWIDSKQFVTVLTPWGLRGPAAARSKLLTEFVEPRFNERVHNKSPTNKKATPMGWPFYLFGGSCWIRTSDQLVKSRIANFHVIDFI
ncbi:hypothetical protein [uncultured Porticoccus sp.]|uniref:hypothetical protein n=1 Tax=uncultured Porticoccus sp. TaxID=1256050 RepID=UPI0030DAF452